VGDESKTRERPTMGRIRELEAEVRELRQFQALLERQPLYRMMHAEPEVQEKILRDAAALPEAQAALEAVNTGDTPGYQVVPDGNVLVDAEAMAALLEEMAEAGTLATQQAEKLRRNAKASYAERLQTKFLEGTSKSTAYWLQALSKVVES